MRIRSWPSYFPAIHWPGAVPSGFGNTAALVRMSACLALLADIFMPRLANRSSSFAMSSGSRCSFKPSASATASRVRSSSVGPRPPVKMMMSERRMASLAAAVNPSVSSPTMHLKRTSTPRSFNFSVRYNELVSRRWGVSNSDPTAMISAFTGKSVNDEDGSCWLAARETASTTGDTEKHRETQGKENSFCTPLCSSVCPVVKHLTSRLRVSSFWLLLRHAVQRPKSPDQIAAIDRYDFARWEDLGERVERDAIVRIIEDRHKHGAIRAL